MHGFLGHADIVLYPRSRLKVPWAHFGEVVPGSTRSGMAVSYVGVRSGNILIQGMCHLRQSVIVRTPKGIALPIIRAEHSTALH